MRINTRGLVFGIISLLAIAGLMIYITVVEDFSNIVMWGFIIVGLACSGLGWLSLLKDRGNS